MVYNFFDKKSSCRTAKKEIISNKELAEELHKPNIRKFNKKSTLTFYRQYLGLKSSRYAFILCATDIYSKYTWVITEVGCQFELPFMFLRRTSFISI